VRTMAWSRTKLLVAFYLALILWASAASAKVSIENVKQYRHHDHHPRKLGQFVSDRVHFSSESSGEQKRGGEDHTRLMCSPDNHMCVEIRNNDDGTQSCTAIVNSYIETTFQMRLGGVQNTKFSDPKGKSFPSTFQTILPRRLPGKDPLRVNLFTAQPKVADDKNKFSFQFYYHIGSYQAKHDPNAEYVLPFEGRHKIAQGYSGGFSHKGPQEFAVDVSMEIGTPILAPRGGIVASVVEDQYLNKFAPGVCKPPVTTKCNTPGSEDNHVLIRCDDGTFCYMAHMKQNGVVVEAGERVEAGQLVGYSGNTGYSRGPHLHTMVSRAIPYGDDLRRFFQSIEITYTDAHGVQQIPHKGQVLDGARRVHGKKSHKHKKH